MIIDDIHIHIKAGKGGDGAVAFNSSMMTLGPTGATGGNGGSVYFEGISDLMALGNLAQKKVFEAESGEKGKKQFNDGRTGKDLVIHVPVGTVVHNLTSGITEEITHLAQKILAAEGGRGGKGNFHFRGPENTTPKEFEKGTVGQEFDIRLELKMIADVGIIGLPNGGKSSLLNELTNAKSKVGNYQFTTLEPNLGAYYELILADIPGLIEGASQGKGLGIKFLKHIERTRILFHLISAESNGVVQNYNTVRKELGEYSKTLLEKEEFVFLSKTDLVSPEDANAKLAQLKKLNKNALPLSIHDIEAIERVQKILNDISAQKSQN